MDSVIRPVALDDAADLATLVAANKAAMAPFDPLRPDAFYTEAGQRETLRTLIEQRDAGTGAAFVILDEGQIAGRISLNTIVRGALQSATLGYWVAADRAGRGLATRAVAAVVDHAFADLCLHRVEAGTLPDNLASQRVLLKNGFERYGHVPNYLNIAGRWQDHELFHRIDPDWTI